MFLFLFYANIRAVTPCFTPYEKFNNRHYRKDTQQMSINIAGTFEENSYDDNYDYTGLNGIFWSIDNYKNPIHTFSNKKDSDKYEITFPLKIPYPQPDSLTFTLYSRIINGKEQSGCRTDPYTIYFDDPPYIKLSNMQLNKGTYIRNKDTTITASGTIEYNTNKPTSASVNIDNANSQSATITFSQTNQFSINLYLPNSLSEDNHKLSVTVSQDGITSNTVEIPFKFQHNAPVFEITNRKDSYSFTKNTDPRQFNFLFSINDQDGESSIIIKYKIDQGIEFNHGPFALTDQNKILDNQKLDIDVPQNLTEGSHNISLWSTDGTHSSEPIQIPFYFNYNSPVLTIKQPTETPIIMKGQEYFNFSITFSDRNGIVTLSLFYLTESKQQQKLRGYEEKDYSNEHTENISFPINQNLLEGEHTITLYMVNSRNKQSSDSIKFMFKRYAPELYLSEPFKYSYKNNIENKIVINVKVRDLDGDGKVTVSLQIDTISYDRREISIESNEFHSLTLFYQYNRNEFSDGNHTLKVVAADETNKTAELTRNIQIIYANPVLVLNSPLSELVLTKFVNDTLNINYTITDTNNPCDVTVKYQIDSIYNGILSSHKFTEHTDLSSFSSTVTIPDSLSEGNHVIEFWAYDGYKESSRINFTFTYSHNTPGPSVNLDELNYNILYKFRNCTVDDFCNANSQASDVQSINITSLIDDSFEQEHGTIQDKKVSQSFSINIPQSLNQGIHHISIKACDSSNRCQSSNMVEFVLKNSPPTDKIEKYQFSRYRKYRMYENSK